MTMTLDDHLRAIESAEPPIEHLQNALQLLAVFAYDHPAVWAFAPELRAVERRVWQAVWALTLDVTHVVVAPAIAPNQNGDPL